MPQIPDKELIGELHSLADELGHPPTLQEYRERGEHSATTFYNRFGSWQDALEAAGFQPREPETEVPKDDLVEDLQNVAEDLGEPPSATEMNEHGTYWVSTYRRRFGSWREALSAAGFDDVPEAKPVSEDALLNELRCLSEVLGDRPSKSEMGEKGKYGATTYVRRFGSWSAATEAAGLESRQSASEITDEVLLEEIRRLADELDKRPSSTEMAAEGEYGVATYQRHFGSWSVAVDKACDTDSG